MMNTELVPQQLLTTANAFAVAAAEVFGDVDFSLIVTNARTDAFSIVATMEHPATATASASALAGALVFVFAPDNSSDLNIAVTADAEAHVFASASSDTSDASAAGSALAFSAAEILVFAPNNTGTITATADAHSDVTRIAEAAAAGDAAASGKLVAIADANTIVIAPGNTGHIVTESNADALASAHVSAFGGSASQPDPQTFTFSQSAGLVLDFDGSHGGHNVQSIIAGTARDFLGHIDTLVSGSVTPSQLHTAIEALQADGSNFPAGTLMSLESALLTGVSPANYAAVDNPAAHYSMPANLSEVVLI